MASRPTTPRLLAFFLVLPSFALAVRTCAAQEATPPQLRNVAAEVVSSSVASAEIPDAPSAVWQATSPPPPEPIPPDETEEQRKARIHAEAEHDVKVQEAQRIAVVVPNFNTVMSGQAVPLSKGQKTELALHATFDPFNLVGAFLLAGASEVTDSDRGFGWGPQGYFKRVGANLADVVSGTMMAGAVYPILLHQDPRYFRQVTGSNFARGRHALLGAVICRGDNGRRQPNVSNILGNFTGGLISNAYYPKSNTGVGLALVNSSIVTVEGAFGNLALEFSPDVSQWLKNRRARKAKP